MTWVMNVGALRPRLSDISGVITRRAYDDDDDEDDEDDDDEDDHNAEENDSWVRACVIDRGNQPTD